MQPCVRCGAPEHEGDCRASATAATLTFDGEAETAAGGELPLAPVDSRRYAVEREHARGGLGRILIARDRRLARPVALKELLRHTPEAEARFVREAVVTAQLQHPGVVPIYEAGRWPSGAPFYAMKLISGRSLHELIKSAPRFEARLALLPNVIAVAETMAYAHHQGIIHRDLKPANVMVGEFGETVIVDWGLATGREAAERAAPIAGTPQYMAPEQARGQALDERADVYALGALLRHVLAGKPPYPASSSEEVLAAIERGAPPPLAVEAPDAAPELIAIVEKAMARAPADRYGSARELAGDLKRFQTGQLVSSHRYSIGQLLGRWLSRHRVPVAVAALALAVLAAGAIVSVRKIVAERNRAERLRAAAEDLAQFMLSDLKEQLAPIGRADVLGGVAAKVDDYYRALEQVSGPLDVPAAWRRAQALATVGAVEYARGNLARAIDLWKRSDAIAAGLPSSVELIAARAGAAGQRALAERDLGRPDAAADTVKQAIDRVRAALARDPGDAQLRLALATALDAREMTEEARGAMAEALATIHEALPMVAAASGAPSELLALKLLARAGALENVAGGRGPDAVKHAAECVRRAEAGRARERGEPRWERALATCRWTEANVRELDGEVKGALDSVNQVMAIREALAARDPGNASWQDLLADAFDYRADLLTKLERFDDAYADAQSARQIVERLIARDPQNQRWLEKSMDVLQTLGVLASRHHDGAAALRWYTTALERAKTVTARNPSKLSAQTREAEFHNMVGQTLAQLGRADEGLSELRASLAVEERLAAGQPNNTDFRYRVADDHVSIGDAELERRDFARAIAEYRAGAALLEPLIAARPDEVLNRAELGRALVGVGEAQAGRHEDGRESLRRGVALMAPLDHDGQLESAYREVMQRAQKELAGQH